MKISIDGKEILTLSEIQKKVIQNDIPTNIFEADMARRLSWCVEHPCDVCYESRKKGWNDTLKERGVKSAPIDKMALADEYFKHCPCDLPQGKDKELSVEVDGKRTFKVTPTHKRMLVLQGHKDPDEHCCTQMAWVLSHKFERCMERLRREWEPKLASRGMDSLPTDDDDFAVLVFAQADYKNRSQRES